MASDGVTDLLPVPPLQSWATSPLVRCSECASASDERRLTTVVDEEQISDISSTQHSEFFTALSAPRLNGQRYFSLIKLLYADIHICITIALSTHRNNT